MGNEVCAALGARGASKATSAALAERAHWLTIEWLPKYAPEPSSASAVTAEKCHFRTHAPQQKKQWSRLYRRLAAFGRICAFRRSAAVAPREVDRLVAAQAFARYFDSGEYSRSD